MSRRKDFDDEFELTEPVRQSESASADGSRSARRKRRRWPWLLLVLAAGVFFLPNMVGWLGIQQRAIDYAMSDFNGTISVEQVSLGWLQPIRLASVTAVDAAGNTLFVAETVASAKPLYWFLTSSDFGQFDIQKPVAYVQLRPDGSNFEDALAKYIGSATRPIETPDPGAATTTMPKLVVNVTDGAAVVSTATSNQTWQFDGLNVIAQLNTNDAPLIVDAQCRVATVILDDNGLATLQSPGGLAVTAQVDAGQKVMSFNSADMMLETENLPLSLCAPMLQRFVGPANTSGSMNGKILAAYNGPDQSVSLEVHQLSLQGLGIVAPELIGSDRLMIDNVSAQGNLQVSPAMIAAQQFKLQSDVGKVQADGSFDLNQLASLASSGQLLDEPFQMDGEVDLAKLIRMLPSTLQLHKDLVINSGNVTFQAGSRNENGIRRMVVNLDTANINARRGSQNIDWAKPLRLVGTIKETEGRLAIEDMRCISDFLTIVGSADMHTGSFVAKGDLDKLMQSVGQFVDLQGMKLAGVLDGKFGWQVETGVALADPPHLARDFPIQIGGNFDVFNPIIEVPGITRWQQQKMSVKLTAAGKSLTGNKLQLDQGGIQIDIGSEQLVAKLAEPVSDAFTNEAWNTNCQMSGAMAGWLGHLEKFVDLGDVAAGGQLTLTCVATINAQEVQFSNIQYMVEQLAFDGYGMKIREPKAVGAGTAVYDLVNGSVAIAETTLSGSSLSARGRQLMVTYPDNLRIDGNVAFKADVNRIAAWYELSPTADSIFWYGSMDGTLQLISNENGIGGRVNGTITDLIAAKQVAVSNQARRSQPGQAIQASQSQRQWQEVWREPNVGFSGNVSLANDFNAIGFQQLLFDSPSLKVSANGSISDLASTMFADISGSWTPSWEKINSLLQASTGELMKFAGNSEQKFMIRGPLYDVSTQLGQPAPFVSPSLQAAASFGWDRGEILGLAVGQSMMEMNLNQSIANLTTNGIPFAGGVVQMAPQVDMRGESPLLTMQRTRIIDNVALQPETVRQWLKYVAPLVADATSAQGNFTVDVTNAAVPVMDPMKMEVEAAVHLSNVAIGAGPAAQQLLAKVQQLRALLKPESSARDLNTWLQMSEQTVPVTVKNGRVYHDNVRLAHKDLVIQTRGSVGFDQSLSLIAEIPIADDWIAGKPYLAGLRGKSIAVPVGGTISKPVLDGRAVEQLSQDLVKQAAGGYLNDKVNQERDKLLGKFNEKLGLPTNVPQTQPGQAGQPGLQPQPGQQLQPGQQPQPGQPSLEDQLKVKAQEELIRGIGNLFGK